ncbi:MAG TPA: murein L,D-transpeptidase family protein [Alphaproteobacteria bacterium]|nr:murein L,D-transpeptidase family protein [Alphaproteobacteria bacterium]
MKTAVVLLLTALIASGALAGNAYAQQPPQSDRADAIIQAEATGLEPKLAAKGLKFGAPVYIAIYKSERMLDLWSQGASGKFELFKSYPICAMSGGLGPKVAEGDDQAPEGFYDITADQLNPNSNFDVSINLGYPNAYDQAQHRTGAALMIHGSCISIGCYAMTDPSIEEIYALVYAALLESDAPVPVHIFPFRMTAENMAGHAGSRWYSFWTLLKAGYDAFAATGRPPRIDVAAGQYVVTAQ